jgi:hypothetical protein
MRFSRSAVSSICALLEAWTESRRAHAAAYNDILAQKGLVLASEVVGNGTSII